MPKSEKHDAELAALQQLRTTNQEKSLSTKPQMAALAAEYEVKVGYPNP